MSLSHRTNDARPVEVLRTATAYITWGIVVVVWGRSAAEERFVAWG